MHAVVISRSAATHAERLPIEHGPRRTPWVIERERSRLWIGPYNSQRTIRPGSGMDYHVRETQGLRPGLGHL